MLENELEIFNSDIFPLKDRIKLFQPAGFELLLRRSINPHRDLWS